MGEKKRQQKTYDLPEDVPGPQELCPVWRDLQGEEKTHLPVQPRNAAVTAEVSSINVD